MRGRRAVIARHADSREDSCSVRGRGNRVAQKASVHIYSVRLPSEQRKYTPTTAIRFESSCLKRLSATKLSLILKPHVSGG